MTHVPEGNININKLQLHKTYLSILFPPHHQKLELPIWFSKFSSFNWPYVLTNVIRFPVQATEKPFTFSTLTGAKFTKVLKTYLTSKLMKWTIHSDLAFYSVRVCFNFNISWCCRFSIAQETFLRVSLENNNFLQNCFCLFVKASSLFLPNLNILLLEVTEKT